MGRWLGLGRQIKALLLSPFVRQRMRVFVVRHNREDLGVLKELVEAGKVAPVIDRRFSFSDVPDALRYQAEGHARGTSSLACEGAKRPRHAARPAPRTWGDFLPIRRRVQSPSWSTAGGRSSRGVQELAQNRPDAARPLPLRRGTPRRSRSRPSSARKVRLSRLRLRCQWGRHVREFRAKLVWAAGRAQTCIRILRLSRIDRRRPSLRALFREDAILRADRRHERPADSVRCLACGEERVN